jgi:hypothetical protein
VRGPRRGAEVVEEAESALGFGGQCGQALFESAIEPLLEVGQLFGGRPAGGGEVVANEGEESAVAVDAAARPAGLVGEGDLGGESGEVIEDGEVVGCGGEAGGGAGAEGGAEATSLGDVPGEVEEVGVDPAFGELAFGEVRGERLELAGAVGAEVEFDLEPEFEGDD